MTDAHESPTPDESIEGVVDGFSARVLSGWARNAAANAPPVYVEVHAGDLLLGTGRADTFRADLAAAGKGSGDCAFAIELDPLPAPGSYLSVTAIGRHAILELTGSPLLVTEPHARQSVASRTDIFPLPISAPSIHGSFDECGPTHVRGWVRSLDSVGAAPILSLREGGDELLRIEANQWRSDLAELHENDGCCSFNLLLPESLMDGELRQLDLCLAASGASVLRNPFCIRVPSRIGREAATTSSLPAPLQRVPGSRDAVTLSVIVNFYNMRREAERTLTSLSRTYQHASTELSYEVLCVDNGSNPPLDPAWIASFGPQFRLLAPSAAQASPCAALNEAALQARGDYLAVMIDGAHLLTPGVFNEARRAWAEDPEAVIALRHWFVGGDQRWLAMAGYTREQEDQLFDRIRWPQQGYELFRIGAPIGESPEPWFDDLGESNCLMLPTSLYDRIGGFDEAFDQAGGGFANLDLWGRASAATKGALVCLIGEASFHQFHGGTTTNVDDIEKDLRVRGYANAYRSLRGKDFARVERSQLSFRGHIHSEFATGVRQRSLLPLRLGITEQVRPGQLTLHFDDGAQTHLQSVYAECGLQNDVHWLGLPVGVAPADLVSLQEIIRQVRPDAIIAAGVEAGLVNFMDSILLAAGLSATRLLHVHASQCSASSSRITALAGLPLEPMVWSTVQHWVGSADRVLVLHAAAAAEAFSVASLKAYASLVSYRSYLICTGTLFGQPWLGYSSRQHLQTIRDFIRSDSTFVRDKAWTRQLISTCPGGYLRKVGGATTAATYDAALDTFASDVAGSDASLSGNRP